MVEDFWGPSKKMLGDLKFLDSLKSYDKDNIPANIIKTIREKYIPNADFNPATIKNVSSACEGTYCGIRHAIISCIFLRINYFEFYFF